MKTGFLKYSAILALGFLINHSSMAAHIPIAEQESPDGEITDTAPTFKWDAISNASGYNLGVENADTTTNNWGDYYVSAANAGCSGGGTCSFTPTLDIGINYGDELVWFIKPAGQVFLGGMIFSIVPPPPPPQSISAYPSGTISDLRPTYTWRAVGDNTSYKIGTMTSSGWRETTTVVTSSEAGCPRDNQLCSFTHPTSWSKLPEGNNIWYVGIGGAFGGNEIITPFAVNSTINHRYVSASNGGDGNYGTAGSPWKTIQHAVDEISSLPAEQPKTLHLKAGTYEGGDVKISGINNLTIIGEKNAAGKHLTIINGKRGVADSTEYDDGAYGTYRGLISAINVSNLTIQALKLTNTKKHAIHIRNTTFVNNNNYSLMSNINVIDNITENTEGSGIFIEGDQENWDSGDFSENHFVINNVTVKGNIVKNPHLGLWAGREYLQQEDITLTGGIDGFQISENEVDSSLGNTNIPAWNAVPPNGGPLAIDVKYGVRHGTIYNNTVQNIPSSGIYVDAWSRRQSGAENIDIYQNHVKNTMINGIYVNAEAGGKVGIEHPIKVYNNVVEFDENEITTHYVGSGLACDNYATFNNNGSNVSAESREKHVEFSHNTIIGTYLGMWVDDSLCHVEVSNNIITETKSIGISFWGTLNDIVSIDDTCFNKAPNGPRGNNSVEDVPVFNSNYQLTTNSCSGKGIQSDTVGKSN